MGENCMFGGQVGLGGHLKVGDRVILAAQSGVGQNVESNQTLFGSPAFDMKKAIRAYRITSYNVCYTKLLRTLSSAATIIIAISVTCAPRARIAVNAS